MVIVDKESEMKFHGDGEVNVGERWGSLEVESWEERYSDYRNNLHTTWRFRCLA